MTTEKTLRKIYETIIVNRNISDLSEDKLRAIFSEAFYPRLYKKDPKKAIAKTLLNIESCRELDYIKFDYNAKTLDLLLSITEKGAKRLESKSDSLRNFGIRFLIALGGAAGTVLCSLIIQLIQSHI